MWNGGHPSEVKAHEGRGAFVAGGGDDASPADPADLAGSVPRLVQRVLDTVRVPERHDGGNFYFAIDHCFPIRGQVRPCSVDLPLCTTRSHGCWCTLQGTVMTGTVLSGSVAVNQVRMETWDLAQGIETTK